MLDYRIVEVIRVLRMLDQKAKSFQPTPPDPEKVEKGLEQSENVCRQQEFVNMTPWCKNLFVACGDLKQHQDPETGEWKTDHLKIEDVPKTKAYNLINAVMKAALLRYNGPEATIYDDSIDMLSPQLYNIDCWRAYNDNLDYWFDIKPGQAKERADTLLEYEKPTEMNVEQGIKWLKEDPVLQRAILWVLEQYPEVRAVHDVIKVSSPFMAKDSNVGYDQFRNDKYPVSKEDPRTVGRFILEWVRDKTQNMTDLKAIKQIVKDYDVYTVWARNQIKGRALEAQSRYVNLVINSLNAPEIEALKQRAEYVGLKNDKTQKLVMIAFAEFCQQNPGYIVRNWDQSGFDKHVTEFLSCLSNAIRYMKCNGSLAKELCIQRYLQINKGWCIDGANKKLSFIYGRTMSGDIDTMPQNTIINWIVDTYANMLADRDYAKNVLYKAKPAGVYLGDDDMSIEKKGTPHDAYPKTCAKFKMLAKEGKYALWFFFLQYRLFKDQKQSNDYIMAYNWPRVMRHMLTKEQKKGMGPVGWDQSGWQQLQKLVEYKPALQIVVSLLVPLNKSGFSLDKDINWVKDQVAIEDAENAKKDGKRARTTAEKLYSGNPQQDDLFIQKGDSVEINWDAMTLLQKQIKDAYIPHFWESLGFKTPDVSKVH